MVVVVVASVVRVVVSKVELVLFSPTIFVLIGGIFWAEIIFQIIEDTVRKIKKLRITKTF